MSTLICIHSFPGAENEVFQRWDNWLSSGCEILGIDAIDRPHRWPDGNQAVELGYDAYMHPLIKFNLPWKLIETYAVFLEDRFAHHSDCMVFEWDSVITRRVPAPPKLPAAHSMGFCEPHWTTYGVSAKKFYHNPWWLDRKSAEMAVDVGRKLIADGKHENGSPDVFFGKLVDECGWKITSTSKRDGGEGLSVSYNGGELDVRPQGIDSEITDRTFLVHGFKKWENAKRYLKL